MERFINPAKEDAPRTTVAVDYKFVRHQGRAVGHLFDSAQEDLVDIVLKANVDAVKQTLV